MGRHAVVSSPLRSPAVLLGVPVATVLATCCSTVVLGGVIPSAEELPLAAATPAPDTVGVPAPSASTDPAGPASAAIDAVGDGLGPAPVAVPSPARPVAQPAEDVRAAPRVVLVAGESGEPGGSVRPAADSPGLRVVDTARDRGQDVPAPLPAAPRTAPDTALAQASTVEPDAATAPSAARSSVVPTETSASTATADDGDPEGSALDLDDGSRGLSVLSFG